MIMIDYYLKVLNNYVGFSGRAKRAEYWWFVLANVIVSLIAILLDKVLIFIGIPPFLELVYALAVLLPSLAVAFRRLHDTGKTGWWMLLILVPIVGAIVLIVFFCQKSDAGKNKYGEPAKA